MSFADGIWQPGDIADRHRSRPKSWRIADDNELLPMIRQTAVFNRQCFPFHILLISQITRRRFLTSGILPLLGLIATISAAVLSTQLLWLKFLR